MSPHDFQNRSSGYVTFADESGITDRFTSIATFSFRHDVLAAVRQDLWGLLADSAVSEFKWQKLKDARYYHCALKLITKVWQLIGKADARVDMVVWDNQDKRHAIAGRDDAGNFGRMFYHLHSTSMKRRPRNARWGIFPDEKLDIDWATIQDCLSATGSRRELVRGSLWGSFFTDPYYSITQFEEAQSDSEPCVQVADLFAGMAAFSRAQSGRYAQWCRQSAPTLGLFDEPAIEPSRSEARRFRLLQEFNRGCKSRKLGVSMRSRGYLNTPDPKNPINFWHYQPQHESDKAPTLSDKKN